MWFWIKNDGRMIPGEALRLNFLTCILELRKGTEKNLNQKIDSAGIELGSAAGDATTLPSEHCGGH